MAKQAYVYSGTDWVPLASEVTNLSGYYTKGEVDTNFRTKASTGLVLLNTQTFSAVGSVSLPQDTFTSTYDNYRMTIRFRTSTGAELRWRGRVAGSDNTTANYVYQIFENYGNAITATRAIGQTSGYAGYCDGGTGDHALILEMIDPKATQPTALFGNEIRGYSGTPLNMQTFSGFTATTSFDSATFFPSGGTITGTLSVYGYNK